KTDRKMMDRMANHATRIRRHIEREGHETVERFLDACLSVEHLIDPHSVFVKRDDADGAEPEEFSPDRLPAKDYMDPFINPAGEMQRQKEQFIERKKRDRG